MPALVPDTAFHEAARTKLVKVLGLDRGQAVFQDVLRKTQMTHIGTADDLFRFGQALEAQGGFAATVGALLCLAAVMQGAAGRKPS